VVQWALQGQGREREDGDDVDDIAVVGVSGHADVVAVLVLVDCTVGTLI